MATRPCLAMTERPAHGQLSFKCNICVIARSQTAMRRGLRKYHLQATSLMVIHLRTSCGPRACEPQASQARRNMLGEICLANQKYGEFVRRIGKRSVTFFELDRPPSVQAQQALPGVHTRDGPAATGEIGAVCIAELEPNLLCTAQTIASPGWKVVRQLLVGGIEPALPYRSLNRQAFDDIGGRFAVLAVLLLGLSRQRLRPERRHARDRDNQNADIASTARSAHRPAAFFTNRSSKVLARSNLAFLSSSSNDTSMSLADLIPAAGMTPVTE